MTEPTRWLDDGNISQEIHELVRAGARPPRFPEAALAATIIPLAHKAALASPWSLPATAVVAVKATSVGLAIGLGSMAAVTTLNQYLRHDADLAERARLAPALSRARTAGSSLVTQVPVAEPTEQAGSVSTAATDQPMAPSASGVISAPQPSGIAAEASLLERARAVLDESPTRALLLTEEHGKRFAKGQMIAERELIAIDALLRLGRKSEAKERARPFLVEGKNQVFAQRLRNLLERHGS